MFFCRLVQSVSDCGGGGSGLVGLALSTKEHPCRLHGRATMEAHDCTMEARLTIWDSMTVGVCSYGAGCTIEGGVIGVFNRRARQPAAPPWSQVK